MDTKISNAPIAIGDTVWVNQPGEMNHKRLARVVGGPYAPHEAYDISFPDKSTLRIAGMFLEKVGMETAKADPWTREDILSEHPPKYPNGTRLNFGNQDDGVIENRTWTQTWDPTGPEWDWWYQVRRNNGDGHFFIYEHQIKPMDASSSGMTIPPEFHDTEKDTPEQMEALVHNAGMLDAPPSAEGRFQPGDVVNTVHGPAEIIATGQSPLGHVYRVKTVTGDGHDFDVWEQDITHTTMPAYASVREAAEDKYETMWQYITSNGGGTFDANLQVVEADHGFATGVRLEGRTDTEVGFPQDTFSPEDLRSYHQQVAPLIEAQDLKLGSWLYAGQYYLDVSQWFAQRLDAILACIDYVQIAAFICGAPEGSNELFVLSGDRSQVLPEVLQELEGSGIPADQAQSRLAEAHRRWSAHL